MHRNFEKNVSLLTAQVCKEDLAQSQEFLLGRNVRSSEAVVLGPGLSGKQNILSLLLERFTFGPRGGLILMFPDNRVLAVRYDNSIITRETLYDVKQSSS